MKDVRRTNFLPLSALGDLDYLSAKYANIHVELAPAQIVTLSEAFESNLPGLSHAFYGDVSYWWVLGLYNGAIDPVEDLPAGTLFRVPALPDVIAFLEAAQSELVADQQEVTV